jgi:hypothetical protein
VPPEGFAKLYVDSRRGMDRTMTPRQRVKAVLRGEIPDQTPFTIYESKLPQCSVERRLRNDGLCIVERRVPVVRASTPNVVREARHYEEDGVAYIRRHFRTPAPDTDLTLSEALAAWPDKVLWVNFPSSLHLASPEVIEQTTRELIETAAPGNRFILGITEDVPEDRWQESLLLMARVIHEMAAAQPVA